jgi:nucleotide-binding universal stress UspA family protein
MIAKKILFPTDFSTCSDAGLARVTALAHDAGAKLLILHVQEPPAAYAGGEMYYGVIEPDRAALLEMLHAVVPTDPRVPCEHWLLRGTPADQIVELANREQCDMIAMATHGRTGFKRLLMGSVAQAVVRRANCAVLTFKEPCSKPIRPEVLTATPRGVLPARPIGGAGVSAAAAASHGTGTAA